MLARRCHFRLWGCTVKSAWMLRNPPVPDWCSPPPSSVGSATRLLDADQRADELDEAGRVELLQDGPEGRSPGVGIGVAEFALVGVQVVVPLLVVERGELGDGRLGHSGLEEVVEDDVGVRRGRLVGRMELIDLPLEAVDVENGQRSVSFTGSVVTRRASVPAPGSGTDRGTRTRPASGVPGLPASYSLRSLRPLCATA